MSSQAARASSADASAFRKSAGTLCTTPPAIPFLGMNRILPNQPHVNLAAAPRTIFIPLEVLKTH